MLKRGGLILPEILCVCVCVLISPAWAQNDDERYAHPDGQDSYGERYEARQVPTDVKAILDDQGHYVMPSFIDHTIKHDDMECWVIDQVPAAGTVLSGTGTITGGLLYTCGNNEEFWARIPIELIDITPPEVSVILDSNVDPQISFGGVLRYIGPAAVVPVITKSDACDPDATLDRKHNGEEYVPGTPITDEGLHFIAVTAVDASGNRKDEMIMFEIRPRPSHTAAAVVESTQCDIDPSGESATLQVTVLAAAEQFDHRDILLSSVRMLARDANGKFLSMEPAAIKGGLRPDCQVFQQHSAVVTTNECRLGMTFETNIHAPEGGPVSCPAFIDLIGVGVTNGAIAYEWGASAPNVAMQSPDATLMAMVNRNGSCGTPGPVPPQPPPACQYVEQFIMASTVTCAPPFTPAAGVVCSPASGGANGAIAGPTFVTGNSNSNVTANPVPLSGGTCSVATPPCSVSSGAVLVSQLIGSCCNCLITFSAGGHVTASASVGGAFLSVFSGNATAIPTLVATAPCGGISLTPAPAATILAATTATTVGPTTASGYFSCGVSSCTASMIIQISGNIATAANASSTIFTPSTCNAHADMSGVASTVSGSGTFTLCPPDPCNVTTP